jgi:methylmalonyl-CoA/ethylmalonyl-CoA epimerase
MLKAVDHIGIAVPDLEAAIDDYRRAFGVEPAHREVVEDQGVEEVLFEVGGSFVQLVSPLAADTPVGKFLERRGPGIHHVGYRVDAVGATLAQLEKAGVRLVDEKPRKGSRGTTIAFVHPKGLHGVLVELVEEGSGAG